MSAKKKNTPKSSGSRGEQVVIVDRHLRLPSELDEWLTEFAKRMGCTNEVDAVRHIVRERRSQDLAAASA